MYIRIRPNNFLAGQPDFIIHVTKHTYISDIEEKILQKWPCSGFRRKLIYNGGHLSPHYRIINYDIQVNDVIYLILTNDISTVCPNLVDVDSKFYRVGDLVEVRCDSYFSWWSGVIVGIKKHESTVFTANVSFEDIERKFNFFIRLDKDDKKNQVYITGFDAIRPRATLVSSFDELKLRDIVLIHCSWWSCRGFWYDLHIQKLNAKKQILTGTLCFKVDLPKIPNVAVHFKRTLTMYKVRKHNILPTAMPVIRADAFCDECINKNLDRCFRCGCYICFGKQNPGDIVLCDECDRGYHYYCLNPPLPLVPTETEWYCPNCINIPNKIVVGDIPYIDVILRNPSIVYGGEKVWGRGMACVGRSKECTIVPLHHFGPVPGVEVGVRWKFRIQVSEAGVHRPPVAGIHGRDTDGAYSLVMAGGYVDDLDNGNEFIYSGSGGRDLGNNKRTAEQSKDQELTRSNKALALNCNAEFNNEIGAKSKNWKKGKPVRVCRSSKFKRFSKHAPKEGIRYDGIYKVVKYYKEVGRSGYNVWKYLLRRDDPNPAPWEKNGQEYEIIYPAGYLEAYKVKFMEKGESSKGVLSKKESTTNKKETVKKSSKDAEAPIPNPTVKGKGKSTKRSFKLDPKIEKLIKSDTLNVKLWEDCADSIKLGKFQYTVKVQEAFRCIVCQEVVFNPVTTECKHNTCTKCLQRSFDSEIFECPYCRNQLGPNYKLEVNQTLSNILMYLLPGYAQYR